MGGKTLVWGNSGKAFQRKKREEEEGGVSLQGQATFPYKMEKREERQKGGKEGWAIDKTHISTGKENRREGGKLNRLSSPHPSHGKRHHAQIQRVLSNRQIQRIRPVEGKQETTKRRSIGVAWIGRAT